MSEKERGGINVPMTLLFGAVGAAAGVGLSFAMQGVGST